MSHDEHKHLDSVGSLGDYRARREHLARVLIDNLPRVQLAARKRLTQRTRGVHDSPDVASSVLRRLDKLASEGRLIDLSDDEIVAFALTVAGNQAVSRTRSMECFANLTKEDGAYAQLVRARLAGCADDEEASLVLYRIALGIEDSSARLLFMLRWRGLSAEMIGRVLRISTEAVRQRWSVLRAKLEARLARGEFDARI